MVPEQATELSNDACLEALQVEALVEPEKGAAAEEEELEALSTFVSSASRRWG